MATGMKGQGGMRPVNSRMGTAMKVKINK